MVWQERRRAQPYRPHQLRHWELRGQPERAAALGPVEVGRRGDRCPSCHLDIAERPPRAGLPNPHRAHPGRYLVQHPPRRFGCSSCHGAGGERLDRCLPAEGDADGRALSAALAQASCLRCHPEPEALPGGERLAAGLRAYRRLGCGGCHAARGLDPGRRVGPPLDAVTAKLPRGYLRSFLADPQRLRPGTAMPSFFSDEAFAGAPAFRASAARIERQAQVEELLAFLAVPRREGPRREDPRPAEPEAGGDAAAGMRRLEKLGCAACHLAGPDAERWRAAGLGGVGPDLRKARERLARSFVLAWLAGPRRLWPETRMPDFRLSAVETADLAALLAGPTPWPETKPSATVALSATAALRGRALAERLGCSGCHQQHALRSAPPAGPELDGFGDKRLELLDWGHVETPAAQRSVWRWTALKLEEPLGFDRRPGVLTMPRQRLRPGEREGLLLLLRGLDGEAGRELARPGARLVEQRRGERALLELGCRQCHRLDGRGGAVQALHTMPAEAPPSLEGEGGKVQPPWLYRYLGGPESLRPWLGPRMPTPAASADERRSLAAALAGRDGASYPFSDEAPPRLEGRARDEALLLFERLQCLRCHLLSNAPALKPGELSPDLALGATRLRRDWIRRFILDPQQVLPGTRMPNLFPLQDEDDPKSRSTPQPGLFAGSVPRQIDALADLSLWWGTAEAARRGSQPTRR